MGGKSDPPAAPNYTQAAQATAAGNLDAARAAAGANRVSQTTPYGSVQYSHGTGDNRDDWSSTTTLAPAQQQLLDAQNRTSLGMAGLEGQGLDYVKNMLSQPFDQSKLPQSQVNAGQTAQDAIMARMNPMLNQQQDRLENQLTNQGLVRGSEAWGNAERDMGNQRNDAYSQAALHGIDVGNQARQQGIQEQNFFRNEPLNTLNAVRTGAQVQNPQFTNVPQQATASGPDLLGATNAQYGAALNGFNAGQSSQNGLMGGLFGLGSSAISAYSDRRLKSNIVKIGDHPLGIGVYEYDIFGRRERGVMADELEKVMPDAVSEDSSGYKKVDYRKL